MSYSRRPDLDQAQPATSHGGDTAPGFDPLWMQSLFGNQFYQDQVSRADGAPEASGAALLAETTQGIAPAAPASGTIMEKAMKAMMESPNRSNYQGGADRYAGSVGLAPTLKKNPKDKNEKGKTTDWCGAVGAYHYVNALLEAAGGSASDKKARGAIVQEFGRHLASDYKIKNHFQDAQTIHTPDGKPALTAQYRSWDSQDRKKWNKDPMALSGNAQEDVARLGVGDAILTDGPGGIYEGIHSTASDHIAWVTGTENRGKNLAFIHTAEGNTRGRQDGKPNQYGEVQNTYLMLPRKKGGKGADKDQIQGYTALNFAIEVNGKLMTIPELIDLGKNDDKSPYGLKVTDEAQPEEVEKEIMRVSKLPGRKHPMEWHRIDGQLDIEQVEGKPANTDSSKGSAETPKETVAEPTVTTKPPSILQSGSIGGMTQGFGVESDNWLAD